MGAPSEGEQVTHRKSIMARTHSERILDEEDLGDEDVKHSRLFGDMRENPNNKGNRSLPTYAGLLPYYGAHQRSRLGNIEGNVRHNQRTERR